MEKREEERGAVRKQSGISCSTWSGDGQRLVFCRCWWISFLVGAIRTDFVVLNCGDKGALVPLLINYNEPKRLAQFQAFVDQLALRVNDHQSL